MKKLCVLLLTLAVGLGFCVPTRATPAQSGASAPPSVSARSAALINASDGSVYFAHNADERLGPASTTKLMTALVVAERCSADEVVCISPDAVGIEGSSVYLVANERLTVRELLYALLLSSANDAAAALAIFAAGSVEDFCVLMNDRAHAMGLRDTRFTNPHGLYDEEHYTTARELALIAAEVLRIPLLREIVSTYKQTIPHDGIPDRRLLVNHNKLLRSYEGAIGMKTGFTKRTGRTLVSAAERDGLTLIAVTLDAPDDWRDHTAMLDWGFESYEVVTFAEAQGFSYSMPVIDGVRESVRVTNASALTLTLPKGYGAPEYTVESTWRFLPSSVSEGKTVGTLTLTCEGRSITSALVTAESVDRREPQRQSPWERLLNFFRIE